MSKVKARLRQGIGQGEDRCEVKQGVLPRHPKYSHLYAYTKPEVPVSMTGPGCYEISGSLEKQSFNKSGPPPAAHYQLA